LTFLEKEKKKQIKEKKRNKIKL